MAFDLENAGTNLLAASSDGDVEEASAALESAPGPAERKALLSFRDGDHWNSLHLAANNGHLEVMQVLVAGLPPTSPCLLARTRDGETALHRGCVLGHADAVKELLNLPGLDHDPQLAALNRRSETPLHCAAHSGSEELIELLIALLAGSKQLRAHAENGSTPLHYAAAEGNPDAVMSLLRGRADNAAVDFKGRTYRDVAHPDVMEVLQTCEYEDSERNASKPCKLLELANSRLSAIDYGGAKRAFHSALRHCSSNRGDWDAELKQGDEGDEIVEEPLLDADLRSVPGRANVFCPPKSLDEMARDAYESFEPTDSEPSQTISDSFAGVARCHFHLQEFSACTSACSAALKLDAEHLVALHFRGLSWVQRGFDEKGVQDLRQAAGIAPNNAALRNDLTMAISKLNEARAKEAEVARRMLEISEDKSCTRTGYAASRNPQAATNAAVHSLNARASGKSGDVAPKDLSTHPTAAEKLPNSWDVLD